MRNEELGRGEMVPPHRIIVFTGGPSLSPRINAVIIYNMIPINGPSPQHDYGSFAVKCIL